MSPWKPLVSGGTRSRVNYSSDGRDYIEKRQVRIYANRVTECDLSDIASPDKNRRTYWYWTEIQNIANEFLSKPTMSKTETARAMKLVAAEIEALPLRGVDEEAATIAQESAEFLEMSAKTIENNSGGNLFGKVLNGAIHGAFFDFSPISEQAAENKKFQDDLDSIISKLKKVRVTLSARHGREFPYLLWSNRFKFNCQLCKAELTVPRQKIDQQVQCPACHKPTFVTK